MSNHGPIVWIAGTNWDGVAGTDKRIVESLARVRPVLWVDPPVRATLKTAGQLWARPGPRGTDNAAGLERVSDSILRLRVTVLPGVTRPGVRRLTALLLDRAITAALSRTGWEPDAVVVAMPLARFPRRTPGSKILYLTDDWLEGSHLMGLSRPVIRRVLDVNVAQADGVAAVSEAVLNQLGPRSPSVSGKVFAVVPNGCPEPGPAAPSMGRESTACLVGQLNERLDLDLLEAVQASGVEMVIIGPRTDRTPAFRRRLDELLEKDNVRWVGRLGADELQQQLRVHGVGLTPYAESAFNRASFPLKTLEYLAAGLGVVSTDMPSARWLNTSLISLQSEPHEFAQAVKATLAGRNDGDQERLRKEFAAGHTWDARGLEFQRLVAAAGRPRMTTPVAPALEPLPGGSS
ncbi:glycosyltransferase [Arthrobacter sp. UYEF36]|uniref:glycosyltransferase n=1 Tax=Arthrobacter sp. UYEF36 TaxID=1756366 RepID=UPI0033920B2B